MGGGGKIKRGGGTKSQRDRRDLQYRAGATRERHFLQITATPSCSTRPPPHGGATTRSTATLPVVPHSHHTAAPRLNTATPSCSTAQPPHRGATSYELRPPLPAVPHVRQTGAPLPGGHRSLCAIGTTLAATAPPLEVPPVRHSPPTLEFSNPPLKVQPPPQRSPPPPLLEITPLRCPPPPLLPPPPPEGPPTPA